jgi:hypothetical protein
MRLIKNVKANWWDHLINLVVVFLGVTIAFQMGNWKENRERRQLEKDFCINLIADLEEDIKVLNYLNDTMPSYIYHSQQLAYSIYRQDFNNDSTIYRIFKLYEQTYFLPNQTTYQSYSNAGMLDVLRNTEIRKSITLYYESSNSFIERIEKAAEDFRTLQFLPYLMNNVKYAGFRKLAEHDFLKDHLFTNLLNGKISLDTGKLSAYQQALEYAQKLKNDLELYVNSK